MEKRTALDFGDLDMAEPADAPPVLFHAIRSPCSCGRSLDEPTYTFFPSAVFVRGVCRVCGPQTAIFAPHMKGVREELGSVVARSLARLTKDLMRSFGESPEAVLAEFLNYLATAEERSGSDNEEAA
jgi:hypothetical protein